MIPSPSRATKPHEKEAVQEIWAFAIAVLGLIVQAVTYITDKKPPSAMQKLAHALYQPDQDLSLERFASERPGVNYVQIGAWIITLVGIGIYFYLKFLRAKDRDAALQLMRSPEGLSGCAHVIYEGLKSLLGVAANDGTLRVTIYRVVEDEATGQAIALEQAIDYVGTPGPSGMGRRFPIEAGIIGRAARTGDPCTAYRNSVSDDEFVDEIVREWGYTPEMARKMTLDRRSFMAAPITNQKDQVLGVVYADSNLEEVFEEVQNHFLASTGGVSTYIEERFK